MALSNRAASSWRLRGCFPKPEIPIAANTSASIVLCASEQGLKVEGLVVDALHNLPILKVTRNPTTPRTALAAKALTVLSLPCCSSRHRNNAVHQTLSSEMLKRQRASSPSPLTRTPTTEVPLISSLPTSSEHGVKRRRLLTPPLDRRSRGWGIPPVPSEDEVEDDDIMEDDPPNPWVTTTTEPSLIGAGEYKAVNSLLHDLHAEQQHRRLMSPSSHSSSSSPGSFSSRGWPSSAPQEPPAGKLNAIPIPYQNLIQDAPLAEKYRRGLRASETKDNLFCDDDVSMHDRYGETNRSA